MFGRCELRPGDDPARSRRPRPRHQPRQSPRCLSSAIEERAQSADTVDDDLRDSLRRTRPTLGDVVRSARDHRPPLRSSETSISRRIAG
jgi:hypothetical protein